MSRSHYTLDCPLCQEKDAMIYRPIDNGGPKGHDNSTTHAWVCEDCPAVLMEYKSGDDSLAVHEQLESVDPEFTLDLDDEYLLDVPLSVLKDFCYQNFTHIGEFLNEYTWDDTEFIEDRYRDQVKPRYKKGGE